MHRPIRLNALLLAAAIAVAGCASLKDKLKPYAPEITFQKATVTKVDLAGASVKFTYAVRNKISSTVSVKAFNTSLLVDGQNVPAGNNPLTFELGSKETREVHIDENISWAGLGLGTEQLFKSGKLSLQHAGTAIAVMEHAGKIKLPSKQDIEVEFSGSGEVQLPRVPEVRVVAVKSKSVDFLGANLDFTYEVKNSEAFAVTFTRVDYAMLVNGKKVAEADREEKLSIPAKGKKKAVVDQRINFIPIAASIAEIYRQKKLDVKLIGNLHMKVDSGEFTLPLQGGTSIAIPSLPKVKLKKVKAGGVDLLGARVDFIYEVTNTSSSELHFGRLAYAIEANGHKVIDANTTEPIKVKGNGKKDITIRHRLPFIEMGQSLVELYQKKAIKVKLTGGIFDFMGKFSDVKLDLGGDTEFIPPRMPTAKYSSFKFKKASLNPFNAKAEFTLKFSVSNPNKFPITIQTVDYSFTADGQQLIAGKSAKIKLKKGKKKKLAIPVKMKGSSIISLVPKLKKMKDVNFRFASTINMEISGQPVRLPYSYP